MPLLDQIIQLQVDSLGSHGEGVGRLDGYTIFVEGALPEEIVEAKIIECKKNYATARLLSIKKNSIHRIKPPCPIFGECGGCQLMHLSYAEQLQTKRQKVLSALVRIGKFENPQVLPCVASPLQLGYRNKIQLPVRPSLDTLDTPREIRLGLFARSSHRLIELDDCRIHCDLGQKAYAAIRQIIRQSGIPAYDPETKQGQLRHVLIKSAIHSKQVLIVLVTTGSPTEPLINAAKKLQAACPEVRGVIHNRHTGSENIILGKEYSILAGVSSIEETLCGLTFHVSAASFFQVNPLQAENLYNQALDFGELTGNETVIDAYCGVGTLALVFAKFAKAVIGIEKVSEAIDDAKKNAERNGIYNTQFTVGYAERTLSARNIFSPDVLLLNPPRKGCEPSLLEAVKKLKPKKIIYISCDPATLARDLAYLKNSYALEAVQPFDMFPQTAHVECVVKLSSLHSNARNLD